MFVILVCDYLTFDIQIVSYCVGEAFIRKKQT